MQHPRYRHRTPDRQLDLFAAILPSASLPVPAWSTLPDRTRQAVTGLMSRLPGGHAAESDADER